MLHLYRIVLVLSLFALSPFSYAKDKLDIVGCFDQFSPLCTNIDKQREYAFYLARKDTPNALIGTNNATLHYIIQSDFIDSVTHYKFSALKDYEIVEGPDGKDMFLPINRLQLNSQKTLYGNNKEEVLDLVSIERGTENLANRLGISLNSDSTFDYDVTCGQTDHAIENERRIEYMVINCINFLHDNRAFENTGSTRTVSNSFLTNLGLDFGLSGKVWAVIDAKFNLSGSVNYSRAQTLTLKWGEPARFTTREGYMVILKPNENGRADVTMFVVPPGIEIPTDLKGNIILEGLEEQLLSGLHNFDQDNQRFISMLAARMQSVRISRLAVLLERRFKCIGCTGKIVDELTEGLGGGQSQ